MTTPSINSLVRYISTKLTGLNWNSNFQKIVDWFTDGTADLTVNTLTTTGDITVGDDIIATGDITANSFIGDGSSLTNLSEWRKNFIINGGCEINNNGSYTLVKDVYGESVDRFEGMATGSLVTAGTFTQDTTFSALRTGYNVAFKSTTITGTGEVYLRHRIYSKSALNFKNTVGSFSMQVWQDVGISINYTIYMNKADALNDFSSVTEISNSGALGVLTSTTTQLKFENISFGDCTNGIEILIKVECGAITTKNFNFAELQLELNTTASEFEYRTVEEDITMNNADYSGNLVNNNPNLVLNNNLTDDYGWTLTNCTIATGTITATGTATATQTYDFETTLYAGEKFRVKSAGTMQYVGALFNHIKVYWYDSVDSLLQTDTIFNSDSEDPIDVDETITAPATMQKAKFEIGLGGNTAFFTVDRNTMFFVKGKTAIPTYYLEQLSYNGA